MNEPVRVLQVVAKMERNGYESRIMDIYRNLDRDRIQFDFYTHRKEQGDFDDEIKTLGGMIYYNNPISPWHFPSYLRELNQFFTEHPYDIVHAHLNSYCAWVLFAAKKHGVKVRIAHSRNSGFDPGWKTIFKRASKLFVNIPPTYRFACSKNAGVWLFGKKFLEDANSKVIHNAFDCDAFEYNDKTRKEVRDELGLNEEIAVVNIGRLTPPKNHQMILNVFRAFKQKHPNSKLFLFGDGELIDQIKELSKKLGIHEAVSFMGNRPNVYRYLNGMDVMLFPSIYEGFGTVAIEAQCNGLPVLASDVLPPETNVTDIITYCSLQESVDKWVQLLEEIISNNDRASYCDEMKNAGYDMKINALNMQNFYLNSIKQ